MSAAFDIHERIGSGGMAEVFVARRRRSGDRVVIKTILPSLLHDREIRAMFFDEARIVSLLRHENIVELLDFGYAAGAPFLAMEHLNGRDLRHVLTALQGRGQRVPLDVALAVTTFVADALHHAHTRRDSFDQPLEIVHRDVTPHNVFVTYDGRVKLLDFGIARCRTRLREETRVGAVKGKLRYLSPEQSHGALIDHRSDIFSLGVMLYEMTTGTRAYAHDDDKAARQAIAAARIKPPSAIIPGYPQALEAVVMQALARRPAERFASAAGFADALDDVSIALEMAHASPARVASFMRGLFWAANEDIGHDEPTVPIASDDDTLRACG